VEDSAIPSGETSICSHLDGISIAQCGQYFDARFQILAPVIFRDGVPDVLLRLANCWRWIDRYEVVVIADEEITGVKVAMKQNGAVLRGVAARDGIGKGDDSILMPPQ
jgi:hypothetical protein